MHNNRNHDFANGHYCVQISEGMCTSCILHVVVVKVASRILKNCEFFGVFFKSREIRQLQVVFRVFIFTVNTFSTEKCVFIQ